MVVAVVVVVVTLGVRRRVRRERADADCMLWLSQEWCRCDGAGVMGEGCVVRVYICGTGIL